MLKYNYSYLLKPSQATYRKNGSYYSDVIFTLNGILQKNPQALYRTIHFDSAIFPNSFYTVETGQNDTFYIDIESTLKFVVPAGNYSMDTFLIALNSLLSSVSGTYISVTINTATGCLTFTSTTNFSLSPGTCCTIFGTDTNTIYTSSSNSITLPYPANLLGVTDIIVTSTYLPIQNYNTISRSNYLFTIPNIAQNFQLNTIQEARNAEYVVPEGYTLDYLDIQIVDQNLNLLNFRNIDWTIEITATDYFEQNKDYDKFEDYIANSTDHILKEFDDILTKHTNKIDSNEQK